jgi:hypothetical protein
MSFIGLATSLGTTRNSAPRHWIVVFVPVLVGFHLTLQQDGGNDPITTLTFHVRMIKCTYFQQAEVQADAEKTVDEAVVLRKLSTPRG